MKKCKCGAEFVQYSTLQNLCTACLIIKGRKIAVKNAKVAQITKKRELIRDKERIKTRSQWMKEAQAAFNSWVRARDKELPCISSGRFTGSFDAGHYRSVGSCPELRFEPLNCHRQTVHDNQHLHGNLIEYRKRLIERIGPALVAWIEGPHEPKKYTIDELKTIKAEYKAKLKGLNELT